MKRVTIWKVAILGAAALTGFGTIGAGAAMAQPPRDSIDPSSAAIAARQHGPPPRPRPVDAVRESAFTVIGGAAMTQPPDVVRESAFTVIGGPRDDGYREADT